MVSKALPSFFHFSGVITPLALDLGPPIGECGTVEVYCNNECSFQYMIAEKNYPSRLEYLCVTVHLCLHENGKSMKGDDLLIFTQYTHVIPSMSVSLASSGSEMSKEGDSKYHK